MRILVTGGAGYVGSVSVERLVDAGHAVTVLDDLSTGHDWADLAGARLVVGNCGDQGLVAGLLRDGRIEAVLHCAARSLIAESMADPALYYRNNVVGGIGVLEAMREAGVRRLVISSTAAVYGAPESTPIAEDAPLRPINVYGETKRTLEAAAAWYGTTYGLRTVSLRYFNVAGASARNGEVHVPEAHLIPNILAAAAGDRPLTLFGDDYPTRDGSPIRDYIHVEDLAAAHLKALDYLRKEGKTTPRMLSIGLHGRIIGRPGRATALERFLEYCRPLSDVWFARRVDIARWWREHYAP